MEIILSAVVALLAQLLKNVLKTSEYMTLLIVFVISLGAAALYAALNVYDLWDTFVPILTTAGAIYTYIIARFEEGSTLRVAVKKMLG